MIERTSFTLVTILYCLRFAAPGAGPISRVHPKLALPPVLTDADDCAIWIQPTEPSRSIVIGNDKAGQKAGLYVYDMNGKLLQFLPMRAPSNLDVRYGMSLGGRPVDLCAVVERNRDLPRVLAIDPESRKLTNVNAERGSWIRSKRPYGLALYKRPSDGAMFAFVSKRAEGSDIEQFQLRDDGSGRVKSRRVRKFGGRAIKTHVEGMVADDELGFLYASDEEHAVLKFHADPERGGGLIHKFALGDGIKGDREGIAIYKCADGTGYLLLSSQGNSTVKVYTREGDNKFLKTVNTVGAWRTDGLDLTWRAAGPKFPHGFLVCHNSRGRNFVLYAWEDVAAEDLKIRKDYDPRKGKPGNGQPVRTVP